MSQLMLDNGFSHDRTTGKEDWLTPPEIIRSLGPFDLDPCSPMPRPWDTAAKHYTLADNGLMKEWEGKVWMNPPYGNETERWMRKLAHHGHGIALIFARTETKSFFPWVWEYATAILFVKGRINFYTKEGRRGGRLEHQACLLLMVMNAPKNLKLAALQVTTWKTKNEHHTTATNR